MPYDTIQRPETVLPSLLLDIATLDDLKFWFWVVTNDRFSNHINGNAADLTAVYEMINHLHNTGKLLPYLQYAINKRPDRPNFKKKIIEIYPDIFPPPPPSPPHDEEDRFACIMGQVCMIRVDETPIATGFLIGKDMVLTNYHAVHNVARDRLIFLFDHMEGLTARAPIVLGARGILVWSPYSASEQQAIQVPSLPPVNNLDYALLHLDCCAGYDMTPRGPRGWLSLPADDSLPPRGAKMVMVHHPKGAYMRVERDGIVLGPNGNHSRINYRADCTSGSSGAPCLTQDLRPLALHQGRNERNDFSQGVPLWQVRNSIISEGLGNVLE